MLVGRLMKECPADVTRIAPLLNGLGGTKYEELFLLWSDIEEELAKHGVTPVQPLVGEFVTSLDMSGCSLTLMWLTERLEALWTAPCDSYVLHQGVIAERSLIERHPTIESETAAVNHATPESQKSGNCIAQILASIAKMLKSNEVFLGQLDAVAGDGDHGTGMARGSAAALTAAGLARRNHAGAASVLAAAGDAWADRAGGTSGAIWGILLHSWSTAFSDNASVQDQDIVRGARLSLNRVMRLGGAGKGDKTLVDAFIAFVETLENAFNHGQKITKAWSDACDEAQRAAEQTSTLSPKRGRARPLAHKSVGHPDPGAISFSLCAKEVGRHLRVMT